METEAIIRLVISGMWGVATVVNLIAAARICYAIEARSSTRPQKSGLPGYANIIPVALNIGVVRDDETQEMRWQMNKRLLIVLGGFVFFFLYLRLTGALE